MNLKSTNNHLQDETSPYLQQHKDNPVEWYPWGETALEKAKTENKPILLSIGYSACHWCHVMAHESFEDPATAALMNQHFINIKVDREERPDLDKIYQTTHSLLTHRAGGWPLTVFLTPDEQMPIFAGTYFPNEARHGMPAFTEIIQRISQAYKNDIGQIQQQNIAIKDAFKQITAQSENSSDKLSAMPIDIAKNELKKNFDAEHGGFGAAPKFPHTSHIEFALRQWSQSLRLQHEDFDMLNSAIFSLSKMAEGGIFDQLGGGFSRYSVDNKWQIPHFEKMLYDNGALLSLYASAYCIVEKTLFRDTAIDTAGWVMREMQADGGAYYSSLDADSDNIEGKFYLWDRDEIRQHIEHDDYLYFADYYGLTLPANFEDRSWNLFKAMPLQSLADKYAIDMPLLKQRLKHNRQHLLHIRHQRTAPATDDKILTSWNALMIRGMSVAGRVFQQPELIQSAENAFNFINNQLWDGTQLFASHKDGKSHLNGYLDDYAFLLDAALELLQAEWQSSILYFATQLADKLLTEFEDMEHGGFYFTGHHHESLILRQKNYADEAMPSGNGIAAMALFKLGHLIGSNRYIKSAERCLKAAFNSVQQSPVAHTTLLQVLDLYLENRLQTVIIRGDKAQAESWQAQLNLRYQPELQSFYIPDDSPVPQPLAAKTSQQQVCAYLCQGSSCQAPLFSLPELLSQLS
ncbi:MAG: thioredoxin domain-containing protein [Gammaproteobacteria bacterium]|nr:thioredoxin domain-containing protein [Gammaproteobacteria bacterium]